MRIVLFIIWVIIFIYLVSTLNIPRPFLRPDMNLYPHRIQIAYPLLENIGGANQNVHNTNVRMESSSKYNRLVAELANVPIDTMIADLNNTEIIRPHCTPNQFTQINSVIHNAQISGATVNNRNYPYDEHREIDILARVYYKYKSLAIDWSPFVAQLCDCVEDTGFVCVTGRVSRYISVFNGVVDGYLGETEITSELLKQDAINRTKVLLDSYFNKNPKYRIIYDGEGSEEEEASLDEFLNRIRERIRGKLQKEYPKLPTKDIDECLLAI